MCTNMYISMCAYSAIYLFVYMYTYHEGGFLASYKLFERAEYICMHPCALYASVCIHMHSYASVLHPYAPICPQNGFP